MANSLTISDILRGRRSLVTVAKARRAPKKMTAAQRRTHAPKPSTAAAVQYLQGLNEIIEKIRQDTRRILLPELTRVAAQSAVSAPDAPDARTSVKTDGCKRCNSPGRPAWYGAHNATRLDAAGGIFDRVFGNLRVSIQENTERRNLLGLITGVAETVDKKNIGELSRVMRIDLRSDRTLLSFIDGFTVENVSLIESVGFDQLDRMARIISEGTAGQLRVEDLAAQIEDSFDVSSSRAALIARDQTLKANADLSQLRQERVGVTSYIWTSSGDERVRGAPGGKWEASQSNHYILDGETFEWASPPITNPETGETNHPGQDYQCRCMAYPLTDEILDSFED